MLRTGVVNGQPLSPVMPVMAYKTLNDTDLKAIYNYLRSVPAVQHHVDNTLQPTDCKLCKQRHGGGDKNYSSFVFTVTAERCSTICRKLGSEAGLLSGHGLKPCR